MALSAASSDTNSLVAGFLAGALLPTLAYGLFWRNQASKINNDGDDEDDDEDDDDDESSEEEFPSNNKTAQQWGISDAPYKMVLVVNQQLSMGKGKIAAQCGHASVACYKRAVRDCPNAVNAWERTGCAKIAVKCPVQDEMEVLAIAASERGIPVYLVEDAGRTQIAAGSRTVLGLGPAPTYAFEGLTSHLKLL